MPWLLVVTRESHNLNLSLDLNPWLWRANRLITMEDAVRALQQQVNALMSQNAALEAQLISQQKIAQGLAELPGAITTVLSRSQSTNEKECLSTRKAKESRQCSQAEKNIFTCGPRRSRTTCLSCSRTCVELWRLQLRRKTWSQQQQLRLSVPELGVETSAEIDGQLFVVLSALTEGESFDIVMSAGGDHGTQRDEHEV